MNSLRWLDQATLARVLGHTWDELQELAESADSLYRRRLIVTREKERDLHIPLGALKGVQRRLHRRVLRRIQPHRCAFAVKGRGTVAAAKAHARHPWFFHTDLEDFYPSVTPARVADALDRIGLPGETTEVLTRLVTVDGQLPQGAPTSPSISELVLNPLDRRLDGFLAPRGLTYTRYADDLTVSGGRRMSGRVVDLIETFIADEKWRTNDKGGVFGPDHRHEMLGLVVNSDPTTSPGYSARLRHFLRLVRIQEATLSPKDAERVAGRIEWIRASQPDKADRLQRLLDGALRADAAESPV